MNPIRSHLAAEQFYAQRDARTRTMEGIVGLDTATIEISIDEQEAETLSGQLTFLLLVNLSARWCRSIAIGAPNVPLLPPLHLWGSERLLDCAIHVAKGADPFGAFEQRGVWSGPTSAAIHVGTRPPSVRPCVLGRGWQAELHDVNKLQLLKDDGSNPLGPTLAACLGACWVMRQALHHDDLCRGTKLSLWNLENGARAEDGPSPTSIDVGRVLLIGTGAVGASIACMLPYLPIRFSDVMLLDRDLVDCSNLNRVPIFFAENLGVPKVTITHDYLQAAGIRSRPVEQWFDEAIRDGLNVQEFDVVIPVANEGGVRSAVQANYPPLMIHGSTGPNWDAFSGRHIPLKDDCLVCRFPDQAALPMCSCGSLAQPATGNKQSHLTGALPFLSLAAATLALSELLKLNRANYPLNPNSVILAFRASEMRFMVVDRQPRVDCGVCPDRDTWAALSSRTKFASLSIHKTDQR